MRIPQGLRHPHTSSSRAASAGAPAQPSASPRPWQPSRAPPAVLQRMHSALRLSAVGSPPSKWAVRCPATPCVGRRLSWSVSCTPHSWHARPSLSRAARRNSGLAEWRVPLGFTARRARLERRRLALGTGVPAPGWVVGSGGPNMRPSVAPDSGSLASPVWMRPLAKALFHRRVHRVYEECAVIPDATHPIAVSVVFSPTM